MKTRITIICENSVLLPFGLIGEHGLSVLIENDDISLFDTGHGLGIMHNMTALGKDINEIDRVIISHGHYDHTSGLMKLLKNRNDRIPVHINPASFIEKIAIFESPEGSIEVPIGMPFGKDEYEAAGSDFTLINDYCEITDTLYGFSNIKRSSDSKGSDERLMHKESGVIKNDPFDDDMTLLIETDSGPVILCGCAHAGIVEILNNISEISGYKEFHALIGGTHLDSVTDEYFQRALDSFRDFKLQVIAPSHCTGFFGMSKIASVFSDKFKNASVGNVFEF